MASPPRPVPGPSRSVTPPPSRSAAGGPRRPALSVGVACLAIFCAYVPQTAVSSALPSIQAGLGVTTGALAWVIDAFVLALAAFIMLSGTLGERYGHKKVLGIAVGLATEPDVLCLDEPATGMTEAEIDHLISILEHVRASRRIAIIVIEHRLAVIRTLCDRVVALRAGEVIAVGEAESVLESEAFAEAFLGGAADD